MDDIVTRLRQRASHRASVNGVRLDYAAYIENEAAEEIKRLRLTAQLLAEWLSTFHDDESPESLYLIARGVYA